MSYIKTLTHYNAIFSVWGGILLSTLLLLWIDLVKKEQKKLKKNLFAMVEVFQYKPSDTLFLGIKLKYFQVALFLFDTM